MVTELVKNLNASLANSSARDRKFWAQQVIDQDVSLESLMSLLHRGDKTSQRFMWFIGDLCEIDPDRVAACLEPLFELRNQMPFPGMQRSVSKWLMLTNVPEKMEKRAISQLFAWLQSDDACIASKSYSAKTLHNLVQQNRASKKRLASALTQQAKHTNRAYACRMKKLLDQLD